MINPEIIEGTFYIGSTGPKNMFGTCKGNTHYWYYDNVGRLVFFSYKHPAEERNFYIGDHGVGRERFFEFLRDKHPAHFEWALWNLQEIRWQNVFVASLIHVLLVAFTMIILIHRAVLRS